MKTFDENKIEQEGWVKATNIPMIVLFQQLDCPFKIVRKDGTELFGKPTDYLIQGGGDTLHILEQEVFEESYSPDIRKMDLQRFFQDEENYKTAIKLAHRTKVASKGAWFTIPTMVGQQKLSFQTIQHQLSLLIAFGLCISKKDKGKIKYQVVLQKDLIKSVLQESIYKQEKEISILKTNIETIDKLYDKVVPGIEKEVEEEISKEQEELKVHVSDTDTEQALLN